jgi:hypothetical protein
LNSAARRCIDPAHLANFAPTAHPRALDQRPGTLMSCQPHHNKTTAAPRDAPPSFARPSMRTCLGAVPTVTSHCVASSRLRLRPSPFRPCHTELAPRPCAGPTVITHLPVGHLPVTSALKVSIAVHAISPCCRYFLLAISPSQCSD